MMSKARGVWNRWAKVREKGEGENEVVTHAMSYKNPRRHFGGRCAKIWSIKASA